MVRPACIELEPPNTNRHLANAVLLFPQVVATYGGEAKHASEIFDIVYIYVKPQSRSSRDGGSGQAILVYGDVAHRRPALQGPPVSTPTPVAAMRMLLWEVGEKFGQLCNEGKIWDDAEDPLLEFAPKQNNSARIELPRRDNHSLHF